MEGLSNGPELSRGKRVARILEDDVFVTRRREEGQGGYLMLWMFLMVYMLSQP